MSYSSRDWWTEFAVFVLTTAACTALFVWLWIASLDGREATANGLGFLVPGLFVGLWAARRYRRRHINR
ncbi:hypothetical protein [Streptomyces sp. NPDC051569]|uniref:hypothetical protein n=1 Tax=Streptomyces sp. NPDC051569 TaxID=3365661 RepID=UPI0037955A31